MRVLYTGTLVEGGTCLARLEAARRILGPAQVASVDRDAFFSNLGRLRYGIEMRIFFTARSRALNAELLRVAGTQKPDVIWIDKGTWVFPSTLRRLADAGAFLVHHNTDALRPHARAAHWQYTLLRSTIAQYDLVFTTNLADHAALLKSMPGRVELTHLGFDPVRFNGDPIPEEERRRWASDVLFVGHWEPRTELGIRALRTGGIAVRVHGHGWERAASMDLPGSIHPGQIGNEDYVFALKSAKIGLGFVSEWNGNQTAGRSFEIPACGTFLLALRTEQHAQLYLEGQEAEFFANEDELLLKARRYLQDEALRSSVAAAGRRKVIIADYSWERYMRDDLAKVEARLGQCRPERRMA
jgi:hypothetical protein